MINRFHCVGNMFFEEPPEECGVKIRDRADDEKDLHAVDGNKSIEGMSDSQRMDESCDEEDADVFFEVFQPS